MEQASEGAHHDRRQNRGFILGSLTTGHSVSHLQEHGFPFIITAIADAAAMGLSTLQVASIHSVKQAGSGVVHLGGGIVVDMVKRHWGLILTGCMIWAAISYVWIGASPNYTVLLIAAIFVSIPGSLWHLPATATLSQRFPDRRGFAISMHGFGSSIGSALGPLLVGVFLGMMIWRNVAFIYGGLAMVLAVFVWWSLRDLGKEGRDEERRELATQLREAMKIVRSPVVMSLVIATTIRGVGLSALTHWTPFYLKEELGMGHLEVGLHLSLLAGMGIVSMPVMGTLSDRIGRKWVLVPGFLIVSVLSMLVVSAGDSRLLIPLLAGMGLFTQSLHQVQQAAVLDLVGRGTEATAIGLIFGLGGMIGIASPFLASLVIDHLGGYESIFYYVGILAAIPAFIVMATPLQRREAAVPIGV